MDHAIENSRVGTVFCQHCGQSVPVWSKKSFCCLGCETVYHLLKTSKLDGFYNLKPARINPLINYFQRKQNLDWVQNLEGLKTGVVNLKIEGIQCAACIWAIREIGKRLGTSEIQIDSTTGQMKLRFDPATYPLQIFLERIQEFGYRTAPLQSENETEISSSLLLRLGICASISMATMCMAAGLYFGLGREEPLLYQLSIRLNYYLSLIAVAVGGSYFFHRAYIGLKNKIFHFDLPIAIGILASFSGSVYAYYQNSDAQYFDSLTGFITLMLAGRYAQERFILKNRKQLLKDDHLSQLTVTRLKRNGPQEIFFKDVRKNNQLLLQSGSIVPVSVQLDDDSIMAQFSLSWINGESAPVTFSKAEQIIPAGACYIGMQAITVIATSDYEHSLLSHLTPEERSHESLPLAWQKIIQFYVLGVISAALIAFGIWWIIDPTRAPMIATAILVITCPCSLGLAIPLARVLANRKMASWGLFARDAEILDKWLQIKKIFFDKTGTLTLASLKIQNPKELDRLSALEQQIIYNMAARSRHPASQTLYQYLNPRQLNWIADLQVTEHVGEGLTTTHDGIQYFLGKNSIPNNDNAYQIIFKANDRVAGDFKLSENILDDAALTIKQLIKSGVNLYQLSGDKQSHVLKMARELGLHESNSMGNLTPSEKAFQVRQLSKNDSLYLGDGLNDSQGFKEATLCGAPVWEKSIMANHADFYFVSGSLGWLAKMFGLAQKLRNTINMNLIFAAAYNGIAVALAMAGLITPVMAAILMPASSILVLLMTLGMMRNPLSP